MPTPFENAQLNLNLFDLRREPALREVRDWFTREFNPESFADLVALAGGKRNASFRMVLSYWNMAASSCDNRRHRRGCLQGRTRRDIRNI